VSIVWFAERSYRTIKQHYNTVVTDNQYVVKESIYLLTTHTAHSWIGLFNINSSLLIDYRRHFSTGISLARQR